MKNLMPIDNITAAEVFKPGGVDDILKQIDEEARSFVPDTSTDKGRKAIASMAAKVAKSKTYLDGIGKDLVSGWKTQAKEVDTERKKVRDTLDSLKIDIRQPLTDWENAEQERINTLTGIIDETINAGIDATENYLSRDLESMIGRLAEIKDIDPEDGFDEFGARMAEVQKTAIGKMEMAIESRKKHEADQAELEELRTKQREQEEREAAEKKEREREEREAEIAQQAAAQAEQDKIAAEERERQAVERAEQAERDAEAQAERSAQAERDKIEREKQAEADALAARERNTKHKGKLNREAASDIANESGINEDQAKKIVIAIAKGKIKNVTINY